MSKITEAMVEAAWQAFGDCPIDMCGDHDEEQKKCVVAAVEAALGAKPLKLDITKEWFEKHSAAEGDLEVGAGFSIVSPSAADIATMERLLLESLPEWAQTEIKAYRAALSASCLSIELAADAYVAEKGIEHSGGIIENAFEAGAQWASSQASKKTTTEGVNKLGQTPVQRAQSDFMEALAQDGYLDAERALEPESARYIQKLLDNLCDAARHHAPAHPPVQVPVVKALEWLEGSWGRELAYGIDGEYAYEVRGPFDGQSAYWIHQGAGLKMVDVETIEAAKAAAQQDYEARIRSALSTPVPDFTPGIVENTEAGISALVIKDGPTVTGQEMTVRPLLDMETRQIVGFQWLSARLASTERTEGE